MKKVLTAVVLTGLLLAGCASSNKDAENAKNVAVRGGASEPSSTTTSTATTAKPAEVGSRSNPVPLGSEATLNDEWKVKVLGTTPNANAQVATENQFNDPPPAGKQFFLVKVQATYVGEGSASVLVGLTFNALDSGNVTYSSSDCGVIPDDLPSSEVFQGGVISGNQCFAVASDKIDSLMMFVDAGFDDSRAFFSLR